MPFPEGLAWVRYYLPLGGRPIPLAVLREAVLRSVLEMGGRTVDTVLSSCGSSGLRSGLKVTSISYSLGGEERPVESWEISLPPSELLDRVDEAVFTLRVDYYISRGGRLRRLASDTYRVRVRCSEAGVEVWVRHVEGLLRTSFDEIFEMFRVSLMKNLRLVQRRRA